MNCQQCGFQLDPQQVAQTGRCPRCGAGIALQPPVAAGAYAQGLAAPANAPVQPMGAYPPPPVQPAYGAPPVPGMLPQGYPGGMLPPPRQKKTGLIAVISAVVVLVLLGGTLLALGFAGKGPLSSLGNISSQTTTSQTPAATPTPSIPAGFQVYTSQGHLYRVAYPSDWSQQVDKSDPEEVEFTGPDDQVALTDDFIPGSGVTPASYTQVICSVASGGASDNIQPTQVTIAGKTWTKMECVSADGTTHTVAEAVSYQGRIAGLLFSSKQASFAQDQAQFFSVMERTFAFLS